MCSGGLTILACQTMKFITIPSLAMTTDASTFVWGATLDSVRTGGELSYEESLEHINVLELTAVYLAWSH